MTSVQDATRTIDCKVPGCDQEALSQFGAYGKLCRRHADEKRTNGFKPGPPANPAAAGREAALRSMIQMARKIDKQAARIEALKANAARALERVREAQEEHARMERDYTEQAKAAGLA